MTFTTRIGFLLFGSGFCALVYQIAWLRQLRLVFGGSTPASSTVLAIFMAGLGIGGLILGRRAESVRNPLDFYSRLEIGISIAAAASVFLVGAVRALYVLLGGTASLGLLGGTLLRLVLAALVLGIPTFLMGGTLPATVRAAATRSDRGRHTVGLLYAVNTVGAVCGAWITTFYLVELLGIRQTIWLAAALNLLIAVAARAVAREKGMAEPPVADEEGARPDLAAEAGTSPTLYRLVLAAAAGVGFVFFLLEIVWYRMMAPILGGSTYTFGVVLAVALTGIGIGGFLYGIAARDRRPSPAEFAATCGLEALAVAIPLAAGDRIAFLAHQLRALSAAGFLALALSWTAVTVLVVFPAAVIAGYQFPLLIALLGSGSRQIATQVGRTYAWNTFGAILGSIAGGFLIVPSLSAPTTWRLSVWLLCGISSLFLVYEFRRLKRRLLPIAAVAVLALVFTGATGPTAFWRHSGIGAGRMQADIKSPNELRDGRHRYQRGLAWQIEGRESSVALVQGTGYAFAVNGKVDGHARGDAPTQVMSGLIGTALHPEPKRALVVGLGTGSSAGWMAKVPTIEEVDAVELEPAILRVAEACSPVNEDVLNNPKVNIIIADAREHLLTVKSSYDVIFSEPSNPYRAGIASLFTEEFYEAGRERLSDDGLFVQWLQAYEVDAQVIRTAYATLTSVFPYVETWQVHQSDLLMIGSKRPIDHSADRLARVAAAEPYARAMSHVWGVQGAEGFYAAFLANADFSTAVGELGLAPVNTDDHPSIEFGFARSVGRVGGFDAGELRKLARDLGKDRPSGLGLDWALVEEARNARLVMFDEAPPFVESDDEERVARELARRTYVNGKMEDVFAYWSQQSAPPVHPIDIVMLLESAAVRGEEILPALADSIADSHAIEADLARALWSLSKDDSALALSHWLSALDAYRTHPWPYQAIAKRGLVVAPELVEARPDAEELILAALDQPFSVRLQERSRLALRLSLTLRPGGKRERCGVALADFEPYVPWTESFLISRRDCYEELGHPLSEQALDDLESYYSSIAIPFWRGLQAEEDRELGPIEVPSSEQTAAPENI